MHLTEELELRALSAAQSGIWLAQAMNPGSPDFNIAEYVEIRGPVDPCRFERALRQVVKSTGALHLRIVLHGGEAGQRVVRNDDWRFPVIDTSSAADPRSAALEWMQADRARAFDLTGGPAFRYALLRLGADRFFWYSCNHHLWMDGYSGSLVAREVAEVYSASASQQPTESPAWRDYRALLDEEKDYLDSPRHSRDRDYWREELQGRPDTATLSGKAPARAQGFLRCTGSISPELAETLLSTGRKLDASLAQIVYAAAALYLHRISGEHDFVLGIPVAARAGKNLRNIAGMVSNVLPLRITVSPHWSLAELARHVARKLRAMIRHQRYRAEELRRDAGLRPGDPGLYGLVVNVMPFDYELRFDNSPGHAHNLSNGPVDDIAIAVYDRRDGSGLSIDFDGNPRSYTAEQLETHQRRFLALLRQIARPDRPLGQFQISAFDEQAALLEQFRNPACSFDPATLPELFEAQALRSSGEVALIAGDETLSYEQLNRRANRLAHYLVRLGAGPERRVGICLPRDASMVVAMLAVLKTGSAYVPLDPGYPTARLARLLADASPDFVLITEAVRAQLPAGANTLRLDAPVAQATLQFMPEENICAGERRSPLLPEHPAYVIYTSGTTGSPKGVVIEHRSTAALAAWARELFNADEIKGVLASTSIAFDVSVFETLVTLINGGTIILARSALDLPDLAAKDKVRLISTVPSAAKALLECGSLPAGVRTINLAGEALRNSLVQDLYRAGVDRVYNIYGPTEDTTYSTWALCSKGAIEEPPIGEPIRNSRAYVLDGYLEPSPIDVIGELYLAGDGLARGYLNRPGLSAERFVADPYGPPGTRMYRTGDRVSRRASGELEFLGRKDHQVKVRGFRIELGEIETVLALHPRVRQAAVISSQDEKGDARLVAYVAMTDGRDASTELRAHLLQHLPEHMLPAALVVLEALPLSPNGKLDLRALPAPEWKSGAYRPPRTPREEILCNLFAGVLSVDRVGLDDDFFALGGHSLLAMRLLGQIRTQLGIELTLSALLDHPTVAGLATELKSSQGPAEFLIPQPRPARLPLSDAQQRLWFLDHLEDASAGYHIPDALRLRGPLDVNALRRAMNAVVARHESLRTHFPQIEGEPTQIIEPWLDLPVPIEDFSGLAEEAQRVAASAAQNGEEQRPFDLARGPLLRVKLLRLGPQDHLLLRTFHHIIFDGWSLSVFNREVSALYRTFLQGWEIPLPSLTAQYADFALWQHSEAGREKLRHELEYWQQQLAGAPAELDLPKDHPRGERQTHAARLHRALLPGEALRDLWRLMGESHTTLYMALLSVFALLMQRYSGQRDLLVGSPVANRQTPQSEPLIGFFSSAAVMRVRVEPQSTFRNLLSQVRQTALEAWRHQEVPFEQLADRLSPERVLNRPRIFQVMLALHNEPEDPLRLPDVEVEQVIGNDLRVRFDLELHAWERGQMLELNWLCNRDLFESRRVEQMAEHFANLLSSGAAFPDELVGNLKMLHDSEMQQIVADWNLTAHDFPQEKCVHHLFEAQAARRTGAIAVECGEREMSYRELNDHANRLAAELRDAGAGPEHPIAICVDRGLEMIAGLLGVMKAGAAYLPLDPDYPQARLEDMVSDSGAQILLAPSKLISRLAGLALAAIALDLDPDAHSQTPDGASHETDSGHLAYIIYTSGSTGRPKGVCVEHRQVVNQLDWAARALSLTPEDRVLQKASFSFDASILEIFLPLACGARIVVAPPGVELDAERLLRLVSEKQVTYVDLTPSLLENLLDHPLADQWKSLRVMTSGAEALPPQLVDAFYRRLPGALWNTYGPTEATVQSTFAVCRPGEPVVPIGRPVANTRTYVLDDFLQPVPVGVRGELYIGGAGVARGYWNRAELTAGRFLPDPFSAQAGARMYHTGDIASWLRDGQLVFAGRADDQIKIRGFRIEPGEIEAVLKEHEAVRDALVVIHRRIQEPQLVAYAVAHTAARLEDMHRVLLEYMQRRLPAYMVPSALLVLPAWPLTVSGKIDRQSLPLPMFQREEEYRAPRTPEEEILCGIFAEALSLERVGIGSNFFALGGHSLIAMRVVSRIRALLGVEVPVRALFEAPSVERLASVLGERVGSRPPLVRRERPARLPLSHGQQRLWFVDQMEGPGPQYNIPLALRLEGDLDTESLRLALADVVARHESLRTIFPQHDGIAYQHILPPEQATPLLQEARVAEHELEARLADAASLGIRLEREIPLRAWLFHTADRSHVLLLVLHHIAGDGWSTGPLARDLALAYQARRRGETPSFPGLPVQYADYALWQRDLLGSEAAADSLVSRQLHFWRGALAGVPEELGLPADRSRAVVASYRGASVPVRLDRELHGELLKVAGNCGASLFMVLKAGLAAMLSRMGAGDDVPLGAAIAGRDEKALEEMVGLFVNLLVIRTDLSGRPSFTDVVGRVRHAALEAYAHQHLPFERLVDALQPSRSQARHPLFQVMLTLQNQPLVTPDLPGLSVRQLPVKMNAARFDLLWTLTERLDGEGQPAGIEGDLEYSCDLFDPGTAEKLVFRWLGFMRQAAESPEIPVFRHPILGNDERRMLLEEFNATRHTVPRSTLISLLEERSARAPQVTALRFEGKSLTYGELNARANRLAHYLITLGAGPESMVGVMMERSLHMVVALLAILKAGAAYLPLDPEYPEARLTHIIRDGKPVAVLTTMRRANLPHGEDCTFLDLGTSEVEAAVSLLPDINPDNISRRSALLPAHPAYVIHTSGSTGAPKGVVITHEAIVNRLLWMQAQYELTAEDRVLQKTPFTFDVSVWEFFWPLLQGATLVIAKPGGHRDPAYLAALIETESITTVHFVPSMLRAFLREPLAAGCVSLKRVICSGEALAAELQSRFFEAFNIPLHNLYGPTEAAVDVSFWECLRNSGEKPVPIGRPIWNTRMYVLDHWLQPAPTGVAGELYLSGLGLARGYFARPGLTAERFVADPNLHGQRMYRTGDLARWRADGALEYLGRVDQQMKVRGFRIEPGEVEAALMAQPSIAQAAVVVRDDGPAEKELVAYVIPAGDHVPDAAALRLGLSQRLPEYMVPASFVVLGELPLNSAGKLDRRALPAPSRSTGKKRLPQTEPERALCRIFADLLSLESVGVDESFFHLGGDSILGIQLVSRARKAGLLLTPRDLFQHPTPSALASIAGQAEPLSEIPAGADSGDVIETPAMRWLLERGGRNKAFWQYALFQSPAAAEVSSILVVLQALLDTHGALRLTIRSDGGLFIPPCGVSSAQDVLTIVPSDSDRSVATELTAAVGRLDPGAGKMMQAVWFARDHRLLLVIHHLAVDGVSWRILAGDLAAAWPATATPEQPQVAAEFPFRLWARHLLELASAGPVESELAFWETALAVDGGLVSGAALDTHLDIAGTARHLQFSLPGSLTAALLTSTAAAFHAEVNDVLLASFALGVAAWRRSHGDGRQTLLLELEGHGRESGRSGIDISRTVGWLTSIFPVVLDLGETEIAEAMRGGIAAGRMVKRIKEQLRSVPGRGLGYGLLRYLNPRAGDRLKFGQSPQVLFNYLGRWKDESGSWPVADGDSFGSGMDPHMPLAHLLEINLMTIDRPGGPVMQAHWIWAPRHLSEADASALAEHWRSALEALVRCAGEPGAGGHTPSDFPLVALQQPELESLEAKYPEMEQILPLSPMQKGMLFHCLFDGNAPDVYQVQLSLTFDGPLEPARMRTAAAALLRRHSTLRAAIVHDGLEHPVQVIVRDARATWHESDFASLEAEAQGRELSRMMESDRAARFAIPSPPLLRFTLVRLAEKRHVLLFTYHHLLFDGWSAPLLVADLLALYGNGGDHDALPPVRPYADYLAWLTEQPISEAVDRWRGYLEGVEGPCLLAGAPGRVEREEVRERWHTSLPPELTHALQSMARGRGLTLSTVMEGLWALLLSRLTGTEDVIFGITVSGRSPAIPGIDRMVGLFINTLPLRVRLLPGETLVALLARIQESQSQMLAVQHAGLLEIQKLAGGSLFDTIMVFENYPLDRSALNEAASGLTIADVEMLDATHYPLSLAVVPGEALRLRMDFNPGVFTAGQVREIATRLERLLRAAVETPDALLYQLDFLGEKERRIVLEDFSHPEEDLAFRSFVELFEAQSLNSLESAAVISGEQQLGYRELNQRANRLAHSLIGKGAAPERMIGVCLERSIEAIVAILAVLKTGAAYVPLDPAYPERRLAAILKDAKPLFVIGRESTLLRLPAELSLFNFDEPDVCNTLDQEPPGNPIGFHHSHPQAMHHPAYVIFTSGSTGTPKGVVVTHAGLASLAVSQARHLDVNGTSRVLQFASLSFDVSVWEIVTALASGAALVLLKEDQRGGMALSRLVRSQGITHTLLPPAVLSTLDEAEELPLHALVVGGDECPVELAARWASGRKMFNAYGPTEVTVYATIGSLTAQGPPPIGRPIAGMRAWVLDAALEPVAPGVLGELYLAGAGLARGYLNRAVLTAERFVANPCGPPGSRMYRTGDLARWRSDGVLEYAGRADHQLKIRGFRVEPGEIETALLAQPGISQCAVVAHEHHAQGRSLTAYIVPAEGPDVDPEGLRRALGETLPEFMVPSAFVTIPALPLSPNGKLDRHALPAPGTMTVDYRPPRTPAEKELCAIFEELLGVPRIGIDDGFFAAGGHSLLAMRLASRMRASLGVELSLREIYSSDTVRELAAVIQAMEGILRGTTEAAAQEGEQDKIEFEEEEI